MPKIRPLIIALSLAFCIAGVADDTEIVTADVGEDGRRRLTRPNLLFIVGNSGNVKLAGALQLAPLYNADITYGMVPGFDYEPDVQTCDTARIYIRRAGGVAPPLCSTNNYFEESQLQCEQAEQNLGPGNGDFARNNNNWGFHTDRMAIFVKDQSAWRTLSDADLHDANNLVECRADRGLHGRDGGGASQTYAANNSSGWSSDEADEIDWSNYSTRTLYTGNYLNWYHLYRSKCFAPDADITSAEYNAIAGRCLNFYNSQVPALTQTHQLSVFNADHLNYLIDTIIDSIKAMIATTFGVNMGLMRFDAPPFPLTPGQRIGDIAVTNQGGAVVHPVVNPHVGDHIASLHEALDGIAEVILGLEVEDNIFVDPPLQPNSAHVTLVSRILSPITEAVYEGMLYFRGEAPYFGDPSASGSSYPSDPNAIENGKYKSPIESECGKNFIAVLSDGAPNSDIDADAFINPLIAMQPDIGGLNSCGNADGDNCLDELAYYMHRNDHNADLEGAQTIESVFISDPHFTDVDRTFLNQAAQRGGSGVAHFPELSTDYVETFTAVVEQVLKQNVSFTSPGVSVNAFNQTRHSLDLYLAMFQPGDGVHWHGNLKKYRLAQSDRDENDDGEKDLFIADANGEPAVTEEGVFSEDAKSFWALPGAGADGNEVTLGGAANRMFDYDVGEHIHKADTRKGHVFTWLNDYAPNHAEFDGDGIALVAVDEDGAGFTPQLLGADDANDMQAMLQWIRGVDVHDENNNNDYTDGRAIMGGVLHTDPVVVNYATRIDPDDPDNNTQTNAVLVTTNDGYFHIFRSEEGDAHGVLQGVGERLEHAAVVPKKTLEQMRPLYQDATGSPAYRLDGDIEIWRHDADNDGDIESGGDDHMYAYFGQRRGGNAIFALDITDPGKPKLLWQIDGDLIDADETSSHIAPFLRLGQTWSKPVLGDILLKDKGSVEQRKVLVFGGGYDTANDTAGQTRTADSDGNAIYMVDATTGALLWWASDDAINLRAPDFADADMQYAFPSPIKLIDVDADGNVDFMFATDMGGQVWRFDMLNRPSSVAALSDSEAALSGGERILGGVVADLQVDAAVDVAISNNRRAYHAPDVSLIEDSTMPEERQLQFAVAIGTGYRAHPLNRDVRDRLYVMRFAAYGYDFDADPITPRDMLDVTHLNFAAETPPTLGEEDTQRLHGNGWYINLEHALGEKSLSESLTTGHRVIFTTYSPPAATNCGRERGDAKVYVVSVYDGAPVLDLFPGGGAQRLTLEDRALELQTGGIPPQPKVVHPGIQGASGKVVIGSEVLQPETGASLNLSNRPRLTFWRQENAQE